MTAKCSQHSMGARHELEELLPHEMALLSCARPDPAEARRALTHALGRPGMDWGLLVAKSIRHGLIQQLATYLRDYAGDPRVPPSIAARVESLYEGSAFRTETLLREAARLVRALDQAGIPSILLKGPALALTVYPNRADRPFVDIDLLVRPGQCEAAGRTAASLGYHFDGDETIRPTAHHSWSFSGKDDIASATVAPEFDPSIDLAEMAPYCRRIATEIHWTLLRDGFGCARSKDLESFWRTARIISLPDGAPAHVLSPEATLIHLAQHAAQHAWQRLVFALDLSLVIRRSEGSLDWDGALSLARSLGLSSALRGGLMFVRSELGGRVPAEALESRRIFSTRRGIQDAPPASPPLSEPGAAVRGSSVPMPVVGWSHHPIPAVYALRAADAPTHEIVFRRWLMAPAPWIRLSSLVRWMAPSAVIVEEQYRVHGRLRRVLFYPSRLLRVARTTLTIIIRLIGSVRRRY